MKTLVSILTICFLASLAYAQKADPDDPANVEKGRKLLQQAVEARGGLVFLGFKSMESEGQWTMFDKGLSTNPVPFLDQIVMPDKERTEFGKGKRKKDKKINVNSGETGWVYDGQVETLKDQNAAQIADFKDARQVDLDLLLRGASNGKAYEVKFYGKEETRPGERGDVLKITLPTGRECYLLLDPNNKLPVRLTYEKNEEQGPARYEYRYNQWVVYDNVKFPNIIDLYKDKIQISRVNLQSVKLNVSLPDSLFVKPESAKAVK